MSQSQNQPQLPNAATGIEAMAADRSEPPQPYFPYKKVVCALGLFTLCGICGGWIAERVIFQDSPPPLEALMVEAKDLDFGEVWERDQLVWRIPLKNGSLEPVDVLGFTTSCSCLKIEPHSFTLAPGECVVLNVTVDFTRKAQQDVDSISREVKVAISPSVSGGLVPQNGWTLHGRVKSPFAISPRVVDFGDDCIRGRSFSSRSVCLIANMPIATIEPEVDAELASVAILKVIDEPGKYEIQVSPNKWIQAGPFAFTVGLRATTAEGVSIPPIPIPVRGRSREEVAPTPDSLTFGARSLGETVKEIVTLHSLVHERFVVLSTEVSSKSIEVDAVEPDSDNQARFRVRWCIGQLGQQTESINFVVRSGERTFAVALQADAFGVPD
jgi:hypothetical protein